MDSARRPIAINARTSTPSATAERRPAYAHIADDLRSQIVSGTLARGDRLASEEALAERYEVSRSTVREALRILTSQNLVVTTRGVTGGTFVAVPDPAQVADLLEMSVGLLAVAEEIDVDQLLFVREALEVPAVRLAATRAAECGADLGLEPWLDADTPAGSGREQFAVNRSFHRQLLTVAGNPLLEILTRPVFAVLEQRYLRDHAPASFWERVHRDHEAIATAVAAGDPDAAAAAMRSHLLELRDTYSAWEQETS